MAGTTNVNDSGAAGEHTVGSTAAPDAPGPSGPALVGGSPDELQRQAKRHLWMHFTRMGSYAEAEVPVIVRGEGCYVYDEHGKRFLDGLSALYCVNVGHGRSELGAAAARQSEELGFFTNWSYAHPRPIQPRARRIAQAQARRAQARLPRHVDGRADRDWPDAAADAVRTTDAGRHPRREHELVSLAGRS